MTNGLERGMNRGSASGAFFTGAKAKEILVDFFLTLLAGLLLLGLSQFLFGSEFGSRAAARLASPVIGAFYGEGAQKRISVVLVDQASLGRSNQSWPVPYAYYADLIEAIASYRPKAIFLDVLLIDRRRDPSLQSLITAVCQTTESGIPVLIAADVSLDEIGLRPELARARTSVGKPCLQPVGVVYDSDEFDHLAWTYPSRVETRVDGRRSVPTAGFALFDLLKPGQQGPAVAEPSLPAHDIAVVWGTKSASSSQLGPLDGDATDGDAGGEAEHKAPCQRFAKAADWRLLDLLRPHAPPACVFHETIRAMELRGPDDAGVASLKTRLADRAVFIGAALAGTGDVIYSPLHGRIPGVYLHAMALDNLLAYGGHPKIELKLGERDSLVLIGIMVALAALVTVCIAALVNEPARDAIHRLRLARGEPGSKWVAGDFRSFVLPLLGWKSLRLCAGIVAMIVLIWFGHAVLDVGVLGFIEVAVAGLTAHFIHVKEIICHPLSHGLARELYDHERNEDRARP